MNDEHDHEVAGAVGARLRSGLPGLAAGIGGDAGAFARIEHGIARHGRRRRQARGALGACGVVAALGGAAVVAARPGDDGRGLAVGTPGSNGTVGTSPASPASVPSDGELSAPAGTVASWPVPGPGGTLPEGLIGDEVFPLIDVPEGWEIEAVEVSPANTMTVIELSTPPVDSSILASPRASIGLANPVIVLRHPGTGAWAVVSLANLLGENPGYPHPVDAPPIVEGDPSVMVPPTGPDGLPASCVWYVATTWDGPDAAVEAAVNVVYLRIVLGDDGTPAVVQPSPDDLATHVSLTDRTGWDAFLAEARAAGATVDEQGDGTIVLSADGKPCSF